MSKDKLITVTSPLLPDLNEFEKYLEDIWNKKWLTNNGEYHKQLETALANYLGVKYISLFTNGTLPLIAALQVLGLQNGEVITTPYSFVATTHSIWWNNLIPVFVDVDPITGNIDPDKIEAAITDRTVAIMPVHVYGTPCDTIHIQKIADKYNLKIIYDAAHAFGVKVNGKSILTEGDISTLSFHATKVYNTVEGGALVCKTEEMKTKIDQLRNFGFTSEMDVYASGINSKMDELRSAYGLLNLNLVDAAIESRRKTANKYRKEFSNVQGIRFLDDIQGVDHNYSYFPIFIDSQKYGHSRDELFTMLKEHNIFARKYFYPLISEFEVYKNYPSAKKENLPVAKKLAEEVLCLPMYAFMEDNDIRKIIRIITGEL